MPEDIQKSRSGGSPSDRQNEEVELDEELDIDVEESDADAAEEGRGVVSGDEREPEMEGAGFTPAREAEPRDRVTRDDGDNDDKGELK